MRSIYVSYLVEGFHRWKDAEGKRRHLSNLHRHLFKVRMHFQSSMNRVEFHDLMDFCKDRSQVFNEMSDWSSQTHAEYLLEELV